MSLGACFFLSRSLLASLFFIWLKAQVFFFLFFFFALATLQHVGSQLPNQGLNPCPLDWKLRVNHWTTREVPQVLHSNHSLSSSTFLPLVSVPLLCKTSAQINPIIHLCSRIPATDYYWRKITPSLEWYNCRLVPNVP